MASNDRGCTAAAQTDRRGRTERVSCTYDYMGRRATKKVETNGETTLHQRYIYRGYLQIACCDPPRVNHPCLWLITRDPTQPIATRPLVIQKSGTWYCYGWGLTKNICEVFGSNGYINTIYTYTPYGEVTSSGSTAQPIQRSSEFYDEELGMMYYNFRHYTSTGGRWLGREPYPMLSPYFNLYIHTNNAPAFLADRYGLLTIGIDGTDYDTQHRKGQKSNVSAILNMVNDSTYYQGGPGSDFEWYDAITKATGSSLFFWEDANNTFAEIRDSVHQSICSEYFKNRNISINIFGWSRGALIGVEVAKLLQEKGCCTKYSMAKSWNPFADKKFYRKCCKWEKDIPVNFIGLFDPVGMAFFNINTSIKPNNVNTIFLFKAIRVLSRNK